MFPVRITVHNLDELTAIMQALKLVSAVPSPNEIVAATLATEAALADTVEPPTLVSNDKADIVAQNQLAAPGKPSAAPTAPSQPTAEAAPSAPGPSAAAPEPKAPEATPPAAGASSASAPEAFDYAVLQKAVNSRVGKHGKDVLLAIAKKHGADTFKALPASAWAAAHADVIALGV